MISQLLPLIRLIAHSELISSGAIKLVHSGPPISSVVVHIGMAMKYSEEALEKY